MLGMGLGTTTSGVGQGEPAGPQVLSAIILGQSEMEYLLHNGPFFRTITPPVPAVGNVILFTQNANGAAPLRTEVNPATVAAGLVNPTMAAWSAFLHHVRPGWQFVLGDGAVAGTSRFALAADGTDGTDNRLWSDFAAVVTAIEAEAGKVDALVECWYNADAGYIGQFRQAFWPMYFGQRAAGGAFTIGTVNPDVTPPGGYTGQVDHILWDALAAPGVKGRGTFRKDQTRWHVITPMPFHDAPAEPAAEWTSFSAGAARLTEPARQSMIDLSTDPQAQSVSVNIGPSAHVAWFPSNDGIHPSNTDPDGQILLGWPLALSLLRQSGMTIGEPAVHDITGPTDGSYVDVSVDLPNGGTLTTLKEVRARIRKTPELGDVERLRWDTTATGCQTPIGQLKVPGVDALPAGFSWTGATRIVRLNAGVTASGLDGWDFTNCYLDIRGALPGGIRNCLLTETTGVFSIVDTYASAVVGDIEHCTFIGLGHESTLSGAIYERVSGAGAGATAATVGHIRFNAFYSFAFDVLKLAASNRQVAFNYFDTPNNLPYDPPIYAGATAYALGDYVWHNTIAYRALQAVPAENAPTGTLTSNAFWKFHDPHVDTVNPYACIGPGVLEVFGNYINMVESQRRYGTGFATGINNSIRAVRNTGSTDPTGPMDIHHNIMARDPGLLSVPVQLGPSAAQGGTTNWAAKTLRNNWITPGPGGVLWYGTEENDNVMADNISYTAPATETESASPHHQPVTGFELARGATRRPLFRNSQTAYPAAHRGAVRIIDAGSGTPKRGKVRITPATPFAFGDSLSYLRGQGAAVLLEPRDVDTRLYRDMLIEHVPALFDPAALYPMEGIALRPYQADLIAPVPAPAFAARSAAFDGATSYAAVSGLTIPAGSRGLMSLWFRNRDTTWNATANARILQARVGFTTVMELYPTGVGAMGLRLNQDGTGSDVINLPSNTFVLNQWYHLLWAWDHAAARFQVYVNGALIPTAYSFTGSTKFDQAGAVIAALGVGAQSSGASRFTGDIGHLWCDLNNSLDLSVAANREKFALAGGPVNLGANGQAPLGQTPTWYYDGAAPAWSNQGTGGNVTLTGTLTAGPTPGL